MKKLNIIITGATGMIGEGVLHQSLNHPLVETVLVITRKPTGYTHPKLIEIIHNDLSNLSLLSDRLKGYNACYFCIGNTAYRKTEAEYTIQTHTLTLNFATTLASLNPEMTLCYISGTGTDSSEKGKVMWARVKGRTENDLLKLPFKAVYNFRPGAIEPFLPLKPSQTYYKMYKYLKGLFWLMKVLTPKSIVTLKEFAAAMINVSLLGYSKSNIEIKDIKILASSHS